MAPRPALWRPCCYCFDLRVVPCSRHCHGLSESSRLCGPLGAVGSQKELLIFEDPRVAEHSGGLGLLLWIFALKPLCLVPSETPLTLAAQLNDSMEVIKVLRNGGAHLDFRARDGMTALHKAARMRNQVALKVCPEPVLCGQQIPLSDPLSCPHHDFLPRDHVLCAHFCPHWSSEGLLSARCSCPLCGVAASRTQCLKPSCPLHSTGSLMFPTESWC